MNNESLYSCIQCPHCGKRVKMKKGTGFYACGGCGKSFRLRVRRKIQNSAPMQTMQTDCAQTTTPTFSCVLSNKIWADCANFLKKYRAYIFAPLIVGLLYLFALWQGKVFPFGKYTAASYDLSAQICPFIEHFFDVFQGKSTLTYTYAVAGGADVLGTILYFFVSPFSFIFLLFGDGKVAHASSFVMLFKLMAIAFSGTWFAKKLFKNIPEYLCVAVGITYTYCGYTFVANTYINWLDFLIYLPFCAGGFKHFVKTENFWPFALLMSACIYTCFSIACFSMFTVFPTLIVYGVLCVEKERKNKNQNDFGN